MTRSTIRLLATSIILLIGGGIMSGCTSPTETPLSPSLSKAPAKPTSGPSVTASDPAFGYVGEVSKHIRITGSGFTPGAQASWERNGAADPKITVVATTYVSGTVLDATISIAGDAAIDLYDVAVTNADRKKGIGYSLFQVTQAIGVANTTVFRGVNSNGEFVGVLNPSGGSSNTAYYFNAGTSSLVQLYANGAAFAIDEAGGVITGNTNGGSSLPIVILNLIGGSWIAGSLPVGSGAIGGNGRAIASDALTGNATFIGGLETVSCKKNCTNAGGATIWRRGLTGWERVTLPVLGSGRALVEGVNQDGVAVGQSAGHAAVWTPDGAGGYTVIALPGTASVALGITSAGDLVVGGFYNDGATGSGSYWTRLLGGGWSAQQHLPLGCGDAVDVDDSGRIVANGCPRGQNKVQPAVFTPPYASTVPIWLGGLAPTSSALVQGMSRQNGWIAGSAGSVGAYWKIP